MDMGFARLMHISPVPFGFVVSVKSKIDFA